MGLTNSSLEYAKALHEAMTTLAYYADPSVWDARSPGGESFVALDQGAYAARTLDGIRKMISYRLPSEVISETLQHLEAA